MLKSAAIYGANASGKSNLIKALSFMKWFMVNSSKETQSTEKIRVEPFRLSVETEKQPSFFEIVFILNRRIYRYGFEADTNRIISEWLYYTSVSKEMKLFDRNRGKIVSTTKYKAQDLSSKTRANALFLSVCAQFNVQIAEDILSWITNNLNIISGLEDRDYLKDTLKSLKEEINKKDIVSFIKNQILVFQIFILKKKIYRF